MDKHNKKSLKFLPQMTSAIVKYMRREYVCSAAQALVLSLLELYDSLAEGTAIEDTGLPATEVSKAFNSLHESGLVLMDNNRLLSVNSAYKPPTGPGQIAINQYQYRRAAGEPGIAEEDRAQTEASVMEDRQHQLDAAIVRVMKKLRRANPSSLYAEVLEITKFSFSRQDITKRINMLVDRDFIEKDPGDDGEIRYLA